MPATATGVRKLQRTLYRQAKSKPQWKAWSLYGEVCRREVLEAALRQVIANGGAPLARPPTSAIPFRRLGDGRRPARLLRHHPAEEEEGSREAGGRASHAELMRLVKGRVSDGSILKLVKGLLRAPIVEEDPESGAKRTVQNRCGTPQGGVICPRPPGAALRAKAPPFGYLAPPGSPLLANLYLDGLDKAVNGGRQMKAVMVRYADDFGSPILLPPLVPGAAASVVLCRQGQGVEMNRRLKSWLERRGLKLNEAKTRIVDFEKERIEFLGFQLSWRKARRGKRYPHCEPSPKSCGKLREAIREETTRSSLWKEPEAVIARVNRRVRGWIGYFHCAQSAPVFRKVQWQMRERMRRWLWKKQAQSQAHYGPAYRDARLHEHYGLIRFPMQSQWQNS